MTKQTDDKTAAETATTSRAKVVLSPTAASSVERFIPRNFTLSSVSGAVVPERQTSGIILHINTVNMFVINTTTLGL